MTQTASPSAAGSSRLRQRLIVAAVCGAILVLAGWLTLVILTRIDDLLLPGDLNLGALTVVPGVQEAGDGPTERLNILVLGIDRRPTEGDAPARTDTMFVMTIDPQSETAGMLGIPRDLWADYQYKDGTCCYQDKINAAYVLGETQGYPGGGIGLAEDVVERNLGIQIDRYVMIDFDGFVELIDALEGIEVFIEEDINDPYYSHTELPGDYFPVQYEAGTVVHMDGIHALAYARSRRDSSDLDRIRRQQQVIFAAIEKARELGFNDVRKVPGLFRKYKGAIETDINDLLVLKYAGLANRIDPSRINALSIGFATVGRTINGASVQVADKELVQELVQALLTDHQLVQEAAHVEVQDGATADGLSVKVLEFLVSQGFSASALTASESADGQLRSQTEIIDFTGKAYTIGKLRRLLDVPDQLVRPAGPQDAVLRTNPGADIVVILGTDAQARDYSVPAAGS